ncbi:cytochrome P450 714C2-like [Tasmannia lanceolata]|uniref:cytochrome P450 714C2-like n=1 Tax=Tasmannia lanceolata TaxID=3420 RepID=UPI004062AE17
MQRRRKKKKAMELLNIFFSLSLVTLFSSATYCYYVLWWKPERIRERIRSQGIEGPPPSFYYGNLLEMKKTIQSTVEMHPNKAGGHVAHNYTSTLFPYFERWRKDYGPIFTYSTGHTVILYVSRPDLVKEMNLCKSLDFGKPSRQHKERHALFGDGIFSSNGPMWTHQRKILAPEFFMDKVKGMVSLMVESTISMLNSWESRINSEGGIAEIRVDEDLRNLSADVISRACFGSSYSRGKEIFSRLRDLKLSMSLHPGIPGLRYLPTKNNRKIWRLEREIQSLILKIVHVRKHDPTASSEKDLLQMIMDVFEASRLGPNAMNRFVIDNCKNIYFAGHETTAVAATWCLMLLALNPEWQDRTRAEVVDVCGGRIPDSDMIRRMKTLTMVIQETLRLYPPAPFVAREAFQAMEFGEFKIPKGANIWIPVIMVHHDPQIWGPDTHEFNPERFSNGVFSACKNKHAYIPFGVGPRVCLGQNFAMVELKVVLSLILSKYSFSLSPKYCHSPMVKMTVEPKYGLDLIFKRV